MPTELAGICTPVCTVFSDDGRSIDEARQRAQLARVLDGGVHIVCAAGGTGEFSFLTTKERSRVIDIAIDACRGRAKVIAHVSAVMTEETIKLANHAEAAGADALLVLPPYFEGPTLEGVFEHYQKVAETVSIPIMAYNIPVHTGIDLNPAFCASLMELPNIRYLKDSTGDHTRLQDLVHHGIKVFVGGEPIMGPALMAGAVGCFWGTSNAIPTFARQLFDLVQAGNLRDATALWHTLYPLNRFIWGHPFNPSVKAATNLLGGDVGLCRRPVQPLSGAELDQLAAIVSRLKETA